MNLDEAYKRMLAAEDRAVKAEAKLARIRSEAEHPSSWTSQLSASKVLAILADNEGDRDAQ
jgi:hypothetical protein